MRVYGDEGKVVGDSGTSGPFTRRMVLLDSDFAGAEVWNLPGPFSLQMSPINLAFLTIGPSSIAEQTTLNPSWSHVYREYIYISQRIG